MMLQVNLKWGKIQFCKVTCCDQQIYFSSIVVYESADMSGILSMVNGALK